MSSLTAPLLQASNLNYALELSLHIEDLMDERRPPVGPESVEWTNDQEDALYYQMLDEALSEQQKLMTVKEFNGDKEAQEAIDQAEMPKGKRAREREEKERERRRGELMVEKEKMVGAWAAGNLRVGEM